MCDHQQFQSQATAATGGTIEHVHLLSDNIGKLFLKQDYSDVILRVENKTFPVHKVILAARSEYFRALLFGGLMESRPECNEVELKDANAEGFHHLLNYIYTGRMTLTDMKEETLLEILGLAHQYGFVELETSISDHLKVIVDVQNVCLIYDIASMYSLKTLCQSCFEFMDRNAAEVIKSGAFLSLSGDALKDIISRDSFCAPEIAIFNAVSEWHTRNPDEDLSPIIHQVRLPLMGLSDLFQRVRPSGLVPADAILDAIKVQNESRNMELNYRGFLAPEENVASLRHRAFVLHGEMKASLLDGNSLSYDLDHGFTRHAIDDNNGQGIVVKLASPYIINTINMLLWDRDIRSYSYYIEVSMDDKDYIKIIDHTKYLCRSWQHLRFPACVCRYIRIVGSHNTVNRVFHLVSFECKYSKSTFELDNGIIVPHENVATVAASACVIEGVSRNRNALINGDTKNYDWDSGYTCHQLGSGAVVVQLAQPYMIGSMRLLLWDCDRRSYSYYIEVSTDQQNWTMVADKTKEACRSWQTITFKGQPVTFIKLVGTHNTANDVFHCVHFECPASTESLEDTGAPEEPSGRGHPMDTEGSKEDQRPQCPSLDSGPASDSATASRSQPSGLHFLPVDNPQANHEDGYGMENMNLGGGGEEGAVGGGGAEAAVGGAGAMGGAGGGGMGSDASDRSVSPALTS